MSSIRQIVRDARAIAKDAVAVRSEWYEDEEADCEGNRFAREFLGTVMALYPSGKYYTPWASSNVEPCPRCKGEGTLTQDACDFCHGLGSREALEDQAFSEALEAVAEKNGCWIESGEGDPCDVFIVASLDE